MCVCICVYIRVSMYACVCVRMCAFVNGFDLGHPPDNLHLDRGQPQNQVPSPLIDSAR